MINFDIPLDWLFGFLLVFLRVGMIFFFFPLFGDQFLPKTIKVLLAMAVSLPLVGTVEIDEMLFPTTLWGLGLLMVPELALGLTIGFSARLLFETIRAAGQFAGMQMGFMMANVVDPANQSQISVIAQMWQIAAIMVFFGIGGHHVLIQGIARSLETLPPMQLHVTASLFDYIHNLTVEMFIAIVQIASPIVAAMILVNACMGLVNKVVPQMHVFIESFPLRLLLGTWMLFTLMGVFVFAFEEILHKLNGVIFTIIRLMSPV